MCKSESLLDTDLGMTILSTVVMQNVRGGAELKLWGGGIVGGGGGGGGAALLTTCPNCRHSFPLAQPGTPGTPCCPELRTFFAPSPTKCGALAPSVGPVDELRRLADTVRALRLSGWYHRGLDWQGARQLLRDASPGAFVVRDSGDRNFIFSLSVQTERGPTSVRLHYDRGTFRLDCERRLVRLMPSFRCAVELVQHYVANAEREEDGGTVWVDSSGCPHSPVVLRAGLRAKPPTLLHSARLAVHRALAADKLSPRLSTAPKHERLPLPRTLITYLAEYPYSC